MILQLIGFEVLTVLNLGFWFVGMVSCVLGVCVLIYALFSHDVINFGETEVITPGSPDDGSAKAVVRTTSLGAEGRSTAQILDQCLSHRSQLEFYHRILCERAGVSPDSSCDMTDLITEAVFDGRKVSQCIYEMDLATEQQSLNQMESEQHA